MKKIFASLLTCSLTWAAIAQQGGSPDGRVLGKIFESGTEAQKDSLTKVIIANAKTTKSEADLRLYYNLLNSRKLTAEAAAVQKRGLRLYPAGRMAREKEILRFYDLKSSAEREKLYSTILKKYPAEKFPGDGVTYDYLTAALTRSFLNEGLKEKALQYLGYMKEEFWRAQAYIPVAEELLKQGDTVSALPLIKQSIEDALKFIHSENQDNKAKFAAVGYPGYVQTYSRVLLAKGQYEEALKALEEAIAIVPERAAEFRPGYAKALQMVGRDLEAFNLYASLYKDGQFNYETPLQALYLKLNKGQRTGWDEFTGQLKKELKEKISAHLSEIATDKETPSFKLRNLQGELVDSKSLAGKIVILDFWATWCEPCKRSFPGMQKAVTQFKDDPDVVFLFIDTWERDADYEQKVKDFIQTHNYTFNVLLDDNKTDDLISAKFGVKGIPAKFVIDKNGKTRFFLTGSSPYPDYILMELTQMIEWARKGGRS